MTNANANDLRRAKQRARQQACRERKRANIHRRRARKRSAGGSHTAADIRALVVGQTDKRGVLRCWWCSCAMDKYHVDHRIALARGGSNDARNLCLSCPDCNLRKHAKMPAEFNGRLL